MCFGVDDLKVGVRIFVVSEYQNSPPGLLENEEPNLSLVAAGNVLWLNISLCQIMLLVGWFDFVVYTPL